MKETINRERNPIVEKLLELNERHSKLFISSKRSRKIHRKEHPTEIAAMKCMDGRIHVPVMTNTPLGIITPWRNIGGQFNLGWPHYLETIKGWAKYALDNGKKSVVFTTYHFARGFEGEDQEVAKRRGCAGHNYDTAEAIESSRALKVQFDRVYQSDCLYAIQCGIDTDLDALILHGDNGEILDLAEAKFDSTDDVIYTLKQMYPLIPSTVIDDILFLVENNMSHIAEIKKSNRPKADSEHRERVLAIGRLYDWLHEPNLALILGPYDPKFKENIIKAAGILQSNIDAKRIDPADGLALLVSAPFGTPGADKNAAIEKAKWMEEYAYKIIKNDVPASENGTRLEDYLSVVTGVCDTRDRKLHLL